MPIYVLVVAIILVASLTYLKQVNNAFEHNLEAQRRALEVSNKEQLVLNEELYQQQEEILSQREFLERNNQELNRLNQKMADNQAILKKALEKLQTSEARVKQQNEQLRQREVQITNSIRAAYTIQQSILPENHKLHYNFSEYFVIYKPRDVVSGDFYWVDTFRNKVFVAAVDCTGHGVPGAFMSLIGNSLLNVIIKDWRLDHPHEVLAQLHEEVQTLLRQKATGNSYGMDIALISIETLPKDQKRIQFAGAKSDLYYYDAGTSDLQVLRGTRRAIGGIQNEKLRFEKHTLMLPAGSVLYLGSDGLMDQNNAKRRKFGQKNLEKLLGEIATKPLARQKLLLEAQLETHMQNTTQRDDILWLGLRL